MQRGKTALIFAAGAGHTECVQLLVEGGARTEVAYIYGRYLEMVCSITDGD